MPSSIKNKLANRNPFMHRTVFRNLPLQSLLLTSRRNRRIYTMSLCHLLWFRRLQSRTPLDSSVFKCLQMFIRSVQSAWQGTERNSLLSDFSALCKVLAARRLIEPKQLKLSLDMSNLHGKAATRVVLEPSFAQHFPVTKP